MGLRFSEGKSSHFLGLIRRKCRGKRSRMKIVLIIPNPVLSKEDFLNHFSVSYHVYKGRWTTLCPNSE